MDYTFKSLFNRNKEYRITTDEPLELYDDFSLSIKKIDNGNKSFSDNNIDCILKYMKHNELGTKTIELDQYNFSGYYMFVEKYKQRNAVSMGEPLQIVKDEIPYEYKEAKLSDTKTDEELKIAFNKFIADNNVMDILFQCFLNGVSYGKKKM